MRAFSWAVVWAIVLALPAGAGYFSGEQIRGFDKSGVRDVANFRVYDVVVVLPVDTSEVRIHNAGNWPEEARDSETAMLARELRQRLRDFIAPVIPVLADTEPIGDRRALVVQARMHEAGPSDVSTNLVSTLTLGMGMANAALAIECELRDGGSGAVQAWVKDRRQASGFEPGATLLGSENLDRWGHIYNIMDMWADYLARFLAHSRGERYVSPIDMRFF